MSDNEMRAAIAETCGWMLADNGGGTLDWCHPSHAGWRSEPLDYPNDLNACHEMEKQLKPIGKDVAMYMQYLWHAMADSNEAMLGTFHATARQRCEAFLRVKGLWKDS